MQVRGLLKNKPHFLTINKTLEWGTQVTELSGYNTCRTEVLPPTTAPLPPQSALLQRMVVPAMRWRSPQISEIYGLQAMLARAIFVVGFGPHRLKLG